MSTTARETTRRIDDRPPRTSHGSRDFTRGGTSVLDRETQGRRHAPFDHRTASPNRPVRAVPENLHATPLRVRGPQRKLGSKQVLSVRGRRTAATKRISLLAKLAGLAVAMLIGGVALAMGLSGVSTEQTFRMQELGAQEAQLNNQLETLHRDLESASSSAEVARHAAELGMAIPNQPGVLAVGENGDTVEQRPAAPDTRPIIDVNGQRIDPNQASSNPSDTDELGDNLEAVPQGQAPQPEQAASPQVPAVAPYEASAPAPPVAAETEEAGEGVQ